MNEQIKRWLHSLEAEPVATLHALVMGQSAVPAWTRSTLREIFIEILQTHREVLDGAICNWLASRIFKPLPEFTPEPVWASHLQDVFRGVAGIALPRTDRVLRDRFMDFRSWLRPFRYFENCDPEAAYLAALAWAKTNQGLEGMWQGIALKKEHEPNYYIDIGLFGLSRACDENGKLPAKAPFLLLVTLLDLAEGNMPHADWELTTGAMLASYHWNEATWVREFQPVLESRPNAKNGPKWLRKILPALGNEQHGQANSQRGHHEIPPAHTLAEVKEMISEVEAKGPAAIGKRLTFFLENERYYANATRNPYYLVRTFNDLADSSRRHDAAWAVARAEEALCWERNNPRNWTVLARCLWSCGLEAQKAGRQAAAEAHAHKALDTLWTARFRFPHNSHIRVELARLHRDAGNLKTAEAIYRETMAEFPNDPVSPTGLSTILFRESAKTHDDNLREKARELLQKSVELGDRYAIERMGAFDEKWRILADGATRISRREKLGEIHVPELAISDMRPEQRLGRALLLQWQAGQKSGHKERDRFFKRAGELLDLSDSATGDCQSAFIEARGFLLLARNLVPEARLYFEAKLADAAPRRPLGLRLGLIEARARLGEPLTDIEKAELDSFGDLGSIAPLVMKVIRLLEVNESDAALRETLISLYPLVRELLRMPASEIGEDDPKAPETPDVMLAQWLSVNVFKPAGVQISDDLRFANVLDKARVAARVARGDILSAIEKLALVASKERSQDYLLAA